jgi:hypothetical protein
VKGLKTVNFTESEIAQLNQIAKAKNMTVEQVMQDFAENWLTEKCGEPAQSAEVLDFKRPCKTNLPDDIA